MAAILFSSSSATTCYPFCMALLGIIYALQNDTSEVCTLVTQLPPYVLAGHSDLRCLTSRGDHVYHSGLLGFTEGMMPWPCSDRSCQTACRLLAWLLMAFKGKVDISTLLRDILSSWQALSVISGAWTIIAAGFLSVAMPSPWRCACAADWTWFLSLRACCRALHSQHTPIPNMHCCSVCSC